MSLTADTRLSAVSLPPVPWRQDTILTFDRRRRPMLDDLNFNINYSESDTKGRYGASVAGIASEAELTISKVSPSLIIADHTYVPAELRGR